jgi:hypothetical protein
MNLNCNNVVRFQVLTAASMKMTSFCDIVSCGLVDVDRRFRGTYCFYHQSDDDTTLYPRRLTSSVIF